MIAMIFDGLHFELRFSVHYLRWRARKVLSMLRRVLEWREQRGMEDVMDSPRRGKAELIGDGRYLFNDGEGSVPLWGQLE